MVPSILPRMSVRYKFRALALLLLGLEFGCASPGPPLPPSLELPKPPTDLHATRKGATVTLAWTVPLQTTDRQNLRSMPPTRICRNSESMNSCGSPVGTLPPIVRTPKTTGTAEPATYTDHLPGEAQSETAAATAMYAVEALNSEGRGAGLSNQVIVPAFPTQPPPAGFAGEVTSEGIALGWSPISIGGSNTFHRFYRIYRRPADAKASVIAGEIPATPDPGRFVDHGFEWEKRYQYRVCIVTASAQNEALQVEGDDTAPVEVWAHDVFPPAVPSGVQAAFSGPGQQPFIDLIWAPDTDSDLAGYNIYRRENDGPSTRLNTELVKAPAYRDAKLVSGKKYFYSVSAVDERGNESSKSEEASESVP